MNLPALARFGRTLEGLRRKGRRRSLSLGTGLDFTSNDYLGIAGSGCLAPAICEALDRGVPVGAGGSRLLRGNHSEFEALEAEAAAFFGARKVLFFGSGYAANVAVLSTLPQRGDLIVHDELIHASAHEGIALSRATAQTVRHNSAEAMDRAICAWRAAGGSGTPWIVVESLYSMDGDRAPLADLASLAERHEAFLIVDEAHATGVFGENGRGLSADVEGDENVVVVHTCGKALGVSGALVTADPMLCDYLVNRARPFIYATSPSPLVAAAIRAALRLVAEDAERRARLQALVEFAGERLHTLGLPWSGSQILPVIVGSNARAIALADCLQSAGFDVRAIRPPTVPEGTARLRIAITLNVDETAIRALMDTLGNALRDEMA
ncbi:8-amino-7-oxononanoate synthase [Terrihabitans sp. B22-R8]|uniref:8-amino-7-oxononanoate synthase n=1 Tax=Terrihabitans sp. B22-R8 TaxID=3425128 RepID=UPI00403CA803